MAFRKDNFQFNEYKTTANGYLDISGIVTRNGVFKYDDGNELRPYQEVFKEESLATVFALPVTWEHPSDDFVTQENWRDYQKGFVASHAVAEKLDDNISGIKLDNIIIQDPALIHEIKVNGLREFSLGYVCDLEEESGEFEGEEYSKVQKNIVYNHLAIVSSARCGKVCSIIDQKKEDSMVTKTDCNSVSKKDADKEEESKKSEEKKSDDLEKGESPAMKKLLEMIAEVLSRLPKKEDACSEDKPSKKEMDKKDESEEEEAEEKSKKKEKEDKRKDSLGSFQFHSDSESEVRKESVYNRADYIKKLMQEKGVKV